jgi:ankyrin repeat protein
VRLLVVVAVISLMTGCDLGPGEPPTLYDAVSQADDVQAKRLLDEGSDPDQTYEGVPVLHEAAVVGSLDTVRALLVAGADPCVTAARQGEQVRASAVAAASEVASPERCAVVDELTDAESRC